MRKTRPVTILFVAPFMIALCYSLVACQAHVPQETSVTSGPAPPPRRCVYRTFSDPFPSVKSISPVEGVFADPAPAQRDAYDIADIAVPLSLPPRYLEVFAVRTTETDPALTAGQLTAAVRSIHGSNAPALSWQGSRHSYGDQGGSQASEIRSVALFLDGLGALALIVASTGILTMMMVGVVERARSIGLRRALGSTRAGVASWLVGEALLLAGTGALLGLLLAAIFNPAAMNTLRPMLPGVDRGSFDIPILPRLDSVAEGVLAALVSAVLFSIPPALMAARVQPAESMREG
jgi:hypothetical protein